MSRRPETLFLCAALALACQTPPPRPVMPLDSDAPITGSSTGIVVFGVQQVDRDGKPEESFRDEQTVRWRGEETGEAVLLHASHSGPVADFWVELPAGTYRMVETTGGGITERWWVLRFRVEPGSVAYVGTIRSFAITLGHPNPYFDLQDDYDAVVGRFQASHPLLGAKVEKRLVELNNCGGAFSSSCAVEPWPEPEEAAEPAP